MRPVAAAILLVFTSGALSLTVGCASPCDRERRPFQGDLSVPEHAVAIAQYACRNECWGALYDLVSEKTKNKYSSIEFRLGFPDLKAPGSQETVAALVAGAQLDVVSRWHWGEGWRLAILTADRPTGKKELNVLLRLEPVEEGSEDLEWHVALQEQVDRKVPFE